MADLFTSNEDAEVDKTSLLWQAGAYLRETIGGVSLGVPAGARRAPFVVPEDISIYVQEIGVSKVSFSNTKSALEDLIDLRATTVSLGNVETRVTALETEIDGGTYS
jgi:hypothetical protein